MTVTTSLPKGALRDRLIEHVHTNRLWGALAADGTTILAVSEPFWGMTKDQIRRAVGEDGWRKAVTDLPASVRFAPPDVAETDRREADRQDTPSGLSAADCRPPDLALAELDWICEDCPHRAIPIAIASRCSDGSYCRLMSRCGRAAAIAEGRTCPAGFWQLVGFGQLPTPLAAIKPDMLLDRLAWSYSRPRGQGAG